MSWKPLGKFVLVRLHKRGSSLDLSSSEVQYNGLADVLAVGAEVGSAIQEGDVVMINGPAGIIAHKALEEDVALVAAPLVLAVRVERVVES